MQNLGNNGDLGTVVIYFSIDQPSCDTSGAVSTGMGDRLRAVISYACYHLPWSTQSRDF